MATLAVIRSRSSLTNIVKKLDHSSKMLTTVSSSLRRVASKFAGTCSPRPSRTYFNHANVFRIRSSPLFFGGCRSESTVAEEENGYQVARDSTDEDRCHQVCFHFPFFFLNTDKTITKPAASGVPRRKGWIHLWDEIPLGIWRKSRLL